eukprot:365122-Chlamydomonas_euryale.AAC.44
MSEHARAACRRLVVSRETGTAHACMHACDQCSHAREHAAWAAIQIVVERGQRVTQSGGMYKTSDACNMPWHATRVCCCQQQAWIRTCKSANF